MKQKDLEEIFDKCLRKWGLPSQILMLAEECSELSVATLHLLREKKQKKALNHFAEEIADTELMLEELKYFYRHFVFSSGSDLELKIKVFRHQKLERLKELLKCP